MTALPRRPARRPIAAVGATGAALGVLAGLLELTIGPSIRSWLGDKHDTTRLGLATIVLALIALGAVLALARRPNAPAPRRFALAITVLVPALITAGQTADERPRSARPAGMAVMILLVLGLQTLGDIGINQNSTVVLRVPVDLLSGPRASSAPPPPTHGTHVL